MVKIESNSFETPLFYMLPCDAVLMPMPATRRSTDNYTCRPSGDPRPPCERVLMPRGALSFFPSPSSSSGSVRAEPSRVAPAIPRRPTLIPPHTRASPTSSSTCAASPRSCSSRSPAKSDSAAAGHHCSSAPTHQALSSDLPPPDWSTR